MNQSKIAMRIPDPKWVEINGNKVLGKDQALVHMVKFEFIHPDYFIVADEVGNNTHQKYGKNGNQNCVTIKVQQARIICATDYFCFIVFFWTASSSKVGMLSVVVRCKQIK